MPTLIRWWKVLRALEVAKWQQKYRVDWNATDGRNGGAQQTVWVILIVDGKMQRQSKRRGSRGFSFGSGSGEGIWTGQSFCGLGLGAAHFSFPRKVLRVLCGYFEHQRRVQFEGCAGEPLTTITAILPRSK